MPIPPGSVPFNRSAPVGRELEYVAAAIGSGELASGHEYSKRCERLLSDLFSVPMALMTASCTAALEICAHLVEIRPGDEVIVPAFSFVSTANAFALRGAKIVFCDIRSDTLNLDEAKLEPLVNERTKAVVPVHYAGVACEMETISAIAKQRNVIVIEDNAHGLFGTYHGRPLGTLGELSTLSFHETKNLTCGEGGALLVNQPRFARRAAVIRDKGTDRASFERGEVEHYSWVDLGSSYGLGELPAAFLAGQLEERASIQGRRERIWRRYDKELAGWCERMGVGRPHLPDGCEPAWHIYYLLLRSTEQRRRLIAHLMQHQILAVSHYQPLHLSEMGRRAGGTVGQCPVTESISARILRLPFFTTIRDEEQQRVLSAILEFE